MSLVINITTPEGMVVAADSRQSYRNLRGISRIGSETAQKLFKINDRIAVAVTGLAFIQVNGVHKNVSQIIEAIIASNGSTELSVKEAAESLYKAFADAYNLKSSSTNFS